MSDLFWKLDTIVRWPVELQCNENRQEIPTCTDQSYLSYFLYSSMFIVIIHIPGNKEKSKTACFGGLHIEKTWLAEETPEVFNMLVVAHGRW